jgi:xylulokinase
MKIIYHCYGGSHSSVLAAAIHTGRLNPERLPTGEELMALPYFTQSGTPYFDTETRGAILGLRFSTKRSDILRALLEGIAFEMRLNLDILDRSDIRISELVATGGGARNPKWLQLRADVLNRPISVARTTEAGCLGVAMLAKAFFQPFRRLKCRRGLK